MPSVNEFLLQTIAWIIYLLSFTSSHEKVNEIQDLGRVEWIRVGLDLVLGCRCAFGKSVYWKDGHEEDIYDGTAIVRGRDRTYEVLIKRDECKRDLLIKNITSDMAGVYRCRSRSNPIYDVIYLVVVIEKDFMCDLILPESNESPPPFLIPFSLVDQVRVNCSFVFKADDACNVTSSWFRGKADSVPVGGPFPVIPTESFSWFPFSETASNFSNGSMLTSSLAIKCSFSLQRTVTDERKNCYLSPPIYVSDSRKQMAAVDSAKLVESNTITSMVPFVGIPVLMSLFTLAIACTALILILRFHRSSSALRNKDESKNKSHSQSKVDVNSEYVEMSCIEADGQYHEAVFSSMPFYIEVLNDDRSLPTSNLRFSRPPSPPPPSPPSSSSSSSWRSKEVEGPACKRYDNYENLKKSNMAPNLYSSIA